MLKVKIVSQGLPILGLRLRGQSCFHHKVWENHYAVFPDISRWIANASSSNIIMHIPLFSYHWPTIKKNSTDELLMIKLVKVPEQDRFINKRFVSEETVVPCQCESETKFGIKQVEWMKEWKIFINPFLPNQHL